MGALRFTNDFFDEAANLTLVRSTYDDTHLSLAYVPGLVLRSDTALFHELPLVVGAEHLKGSIGAGVTYVGPRPLPYGQQSEKLFTTDLSASLNWSCLRARLLGQQPVRRALSAR